MTPVVARGPAGLRGLVGSELPASPWLEMTQERVDAFAESSGDRQWIHVDPARAASGPFGGTIAHGFLTLSLASRFWEEAVRVEGFKMAVNYGLNRVRFPAPVPVGSRVRGRFEVLDVVDVEGALRATIGATVEREGHAKPVCVAELVLRFVR